MEAAAETFALPPARLRATLHYYAAHTDEIDGEVDQAVAESTLAESAWEAERRLLT